MPESTGEPEPTEARLESSSSEESDRAGNRSVSEEDELKLRIGGPRSRPAIGRSRPKVLPTQSLGLRKRRRQPMSIFADIQACFP